MSFALLQRVFSSSFTTCLRGYRYCKTIPGGQFYSKSTSERNSQAERLSHYFGHEEVTPNNKREKVQEVFNEVAAKYDLMNDVMSLGIHRFWKDYFIQTLAPTPGMKILDVAGGTGDIAFRFLRASLENDIPLQSALIEEKSSSDTRSHAVIFDINEKMLSLCQEKAIHFGLDKYLTYVQGNAEKLPFENNSFDVYTVAFGIRNVVHIDKALSEAFRVLKPGGRFLCLEFSEVKNSTFYRVYDWYSQEIIPVLGQIIVGNWKPYQYLVESIQRFPNQEEFSVMIEDAGFTSISYENLSNGISAIHSGYKL